MKEKIHLASNLKYLITLHGSTQTKTSKELGFADSTMSNYINERSAPDPQRLLVIANHFGFTTDELLKLDFVKEGVPKKGIGISKENKRLLDKIRLLEAVLDTPAGQEALDAALRELEDAKKTVG